MTLLERMPAARRIETTAGQAQAFELAGHISEADIENLYGLLEGAYAIHPEIDLLIRFVDYDGIDWKTLFSKTAASGGSHASRHIRRTALVGGPDWIATAAGFLAPFVSLDLKHFEAGDEALAWAHIGAAPAEDG